MKKYLGIDIGGTAIKYALMDKEANILKKGETPTPRNDFDQFLEALDSVVLPLKEQVEGIAISMPGRINVEMGIAYTGGALSFINSTPIRDILQQRYDLPVELDNDAKCAAAAEVYYGNLADIDSGVVLILGTGIGGGIVLNHKVYRGMNFAAGEVSNTPCDYEDYGGKIWYEIGAVRGLLIPYADSKGIDYHETNGREFFEAYHNGDEDAIASLKHYAKVIAQGIVNIQIILDVEKYCIGGGISAQDVLIDEIRNAIDELFEIKGVLYPVIKPLIDKCKFRNDANLIGALANFLQIHKPC